MSMFRVLGWVVALVGAVMMMASCARPTSPDLIWATGFAELPTGCADLGESVDGAVRGFMGAFPDHDRDMFTRSDSSTSLWCSLTAEDPVPRGDRMPSTGPVSRTATVSLSISTSPMLERSSSAPQTPSLRERTTPTSAVSVPVDLIGIGDESVIWMEQKTSDAVRVEAIAVLDNMHIRVTTSGYDWTGAQGFPSGDTPQLRADLRSGAESIIAAVARTVPPRLPVAVLEEHDATPSSTTTATANPESPVWDPCALPTSALADFGLTRDGDGDPDSTGSKFCYWRGPWYNVSIESTDEWFLRRFYDRDRYAAPQPVQVGGRHGVRLYWAESGYFCDLAFDVPQGEREGVPVGAVLIEVNTGVRTGLRDEACAQLTKIAEAVVAHLPPGR